MPIYHKPIIAKELEDEKLETVSGGDSANENDHVFAYAVGFNFVARCGTGKVYKVEERYVENGVNKYKLSVYSMRMKTGLHFEGYDYLTELEISSLL